MSTTPEADNPQRPAALRLLDGDTEDLWPTAHRRPVNPTSVPTATTPAHAANIDHSGPLDTPGDASSPVRGPESTPLLRVVDDATLPTPADPTAEATGPEGTLLAAIERAETAEATIRDLRAEIQRLNNQMVKQAVEPQPHALPRAATLGASPYAVEAFLNAAAGGDIDLEHLLKLVHVLSRKEPDLSRAAALATWATADAARARKEAERLKKRLLAYAGEVPPTAAAHGVIADFSEALTAQSMRALTQRAVETHLDRVEDEYATGGAYVRAQMEADTEKHWADLHGYVPGD